MKNDTLSICFDESSHTTTINLFQGTLVTDAMALPLSFFLYEPQDAWADDARSCLQSLADVLPDHVEIIILADRIHAGKPFITCIEALGWNYSIRVPKIPILKQKKAWMPVKNLHPRRYPTRRWEAVKIWKTNAIHSTIVIHRHEQDGYTTVVWYVITNLPPTEHCCVIYTCQ